MKVLWISIPLFLAGCEAIAPDRSALLATSNAPVERPRCDACHGYAPRTGAHRFHLDPTTGRAPNSCEDCHAASIVMSGPVMDSVFSRTFPNPRDPSTDTTIYNGTAETPWLPFSRTGMVFEPDLSQMVDSIPRMAHPRRADMEFPEWMVRGSDRADVPGHANGKVDVVFAETHNERGTVAVWNPQRMTCSSVKCHEQPDPGQTRYTWKER